MPEQESIFRIAITAPDRDSLMKLVMDKDLSMGGGGPRQQPDGTVKVEAYVPAQMLEQLKKTTFKIEVMEDATKVGKERQKEVGVGDRFMGGREAPRGLGLKKEKKP